MAKYLSWNKIPKITPESIKEIGGSSDLFDKQRAPYTIYGLGRSYGDVCLTGKGTLLLSRGLNEFINFDSVNGKIRCEAGTSLNEILQLVTQQGWFIPVVPGTRFVTLGGAVANDIHGKNNHKVGSFGNFVRKFELLRSDGERVVCSKSNNEGLFHATIGGLGLTGIITWVEIDLIPITNNFINVGIEGFKLIDDYWDINKQLETDWDYTVAWLDCISGGSSMGRGIFHSGKHSSQETGLPKYREIKVTFPIEFPFPLINSFYSRVINSMYYRSNLGRGTLIKHYKPFFFPLDSINYWNRAYGKKGFFQYQCVFPPENSKVGVSQILEVINKSNQNSYLGVLKSFGNVKPEGMMSFPRPGTTITLDFPNKGDQTLHLFNELDSIVSTLKGALYPAKDARMSGEMFRLSFPRYDEFSQYIDPKFSSSFWERVN